MPRRLPPRGDRIENYNNIEVHVYDKINEIRVLLKENMEDDFSSLYTILNKYSNRTVRIIGIYSTRSLNKIIEILHNFNYSGTIILQIAPGIKNLYNDKKINLELLPDNVKISGFGNLHNQTEFKTWCHNLNQKDKKTLLNCLDEESKMNFLIEEKVICEFYSTITRLYPDIMRYSPSDRMKKIFDYVKEKYPYAFECLNSTMDAVIPGTLWSQSAIETYRRGRGVCQGRANLLTLVTNNPLLKLDCVTVDGKIPGNVGHSWNEFIDEDGKVTHYDLSFNKKGIPTRKMSGYTIKEEYPYIKEMREQGELEELNRRQAPPPLPQRRQTLPPLPPRRDTEEPKIRVLRRPLPPRRH